LIVPDALEDETFRDNPLVVDGPRIRFYAGAPIYLQSGHCVGSLCVLDERPHLDFDDGKLRILEELASVVSEMIEARSARSQSAIAARVVESTPDAVLATNSSAEIVYWNEAAERMFGWAADEARSQNVQLIIPQKFHDGHQDRFEAAAKGGPTRLVGKFVELEARHKDGSVFPVELSLAPWGNKSHGGFAAVVRDISERKALQADRDNSKKFLDAVVTNLPSMLFVKDTQTYRYLLVNKKAEQIIGRSARSMIGRDDDELFPARGHEFRRNDAKVVASGMPERMESEFERDDGRRVNIRTTRVLLDGPDRPNQYLLGLSEDVTEIRQSEAERWKLARYDTLTGLLNRASFLEITDKLIHENIRFAILNIDLDRFKSVNDQFGHVIGDEVLKLIGDRLSGLADDDTYVARIGGDEFVCLLTGQALRARGREISARLIEGISAPISVRGVTAHIGASIGGVVFPDDGDNVETLRQHSDLAMYRAKHEGKGQPRFFDAHMDAAERDRRKLETNLREAVKANLIEVAYQPIVQVSTGEITSFEALARWNEPDRGPVAPDVFIPLAEDCGLIEAMGEHVLRRACTDALRWPSHIKVAVNLSPRQFLSGRLVDTVLAVLKETGLHPYRLHLEVTESFVIDKAEEAFSQLEQLKQHGIQMSVDDFGIGYSSLSYFQAFRFNNVKIDKSFIGEIESSQAAKAIVTAVVGLAQQLSMAVVAEGVETPLQKRALAELGCSHLQGYLFSPPISPVQVDALLSHQSGLRDYERFEAVA
jgi:diguanylate cyclase (GGDEF)-like protein/PAS domain S-box-containing protein